MNNFTQRTITGAVYLITVFCAIMFNPIILSVFFGLIALISLYEFYDNSKKTNIITQNILGFSLAITTYCSFVFYAFHIENTYFIIASLIFCFIIFIFELYKNKENPFTNISYTLVAVIYIVIPMGLTNFIVNPTISLNSFTPILLLSVFILAWTNDTFAYLVGVKFGKHRLFERISPKKSWEGFFGGLIATQIVSIILFKLTNTSLYFYDWMTIGIIISVIGTYGDLVESMFKRQIGVKDSGKILPGHGGILDRFDILFISIPFIFSYLYLRLN
ncbi:MAG: phosphatidate cytidylyltransferase [Bacteroidales bacterium]|jgi:phosphatidate cytidylyltransferase|nr:phosphatidate cytidylyltransferase [Bacteroidales bacterium]